MKKIISIIIGFAVFFALGFYFNKIRNNNIEKKSGNEIANTTQTIRNGINMKLGAFSVSLNVKDINTSKMFYENLGYKQFGGSIDKNYLIMKNENSLIGLFQGMFEGNILTFNPGWNESAQEIEDFVDVRIIKQELKSKGVDTGAEIDDNSSGPASFMVTDPDGNVILIDQHR